MTRGIPPARWRSVATYRPDGFRSHRCGVRRRIASKSSRSSGTSAARAIARRWSTAFVLPPMAITTVMAFSKAARVRRSRGRTSAAMQRSSASAAASVERVFSSSSAASVLEYGNDRPSASIAEDIVLAVYIPPQLPWPGQAWRSIAWNVSSGMRPAAYSPTASNTDTMVRSWPSWWPGLIVPP